VSTALYRRYRPESFADVIGQEHVTEPLMAALSKNRVNHAYLFSGPRGCGKTTSARILARCLNCAEGPTPTPCGKCDSCVELARNGSGSLDVIEIDAASHGGVDDARDLRERATFAPVRDRYKIFIIDEAHMVTSAGFNALLKIVEEPPEHIKFIFATTEPDKVIGTIRSRTHHYPFRLVPPEPLLAYLEKLASQENVPVAPGVLSLVIRAGGGSVRDSLSVLDQLMAGAGESGLDYELAVNLLGYTHVALLDDVVDAFAAGDATTVFSAIDRVIQTGQDPRRFVEDLLERFRDLIVVNAMPDSAAAVLRGVPEDQINRMHTQAAQFGGAELSRAADITNTALTEMTGATSPRLHLELLCARILLPAADQSERGTAARVDRLERRLSYAGDSAAAPMGAGEAPQASVPATERPTAAQRPAASAPAAADPRNTPQQAPEPAAPASGGAADWGGTWATPAPASSPSTASSSAGSTAPAASSRTWDDVSREAAQQQPNGQATSAPSRDSVPEQDSHSSAQPSGTRQPQEQQTPAAAPSDAAPGSTAPASSAPVNPEPVSAGPSAADSHSGSPADGAPGSSAAPTAAPAPQEASRPAAGGGQIEMIRRAWPEIMDALTSIRRATWLNVSKNASPRGFDGRVLELAFSNPGAATNFNRPDHLENLRKAIHQVLGVDSQVNVVHDSAAAAGEPGPKAGSRPNAPAQVPAPAPAQPATGAAAPASASVPGASLPSPAAPGASLPSGASGSTSAAPGSPSGAPTQRQGSQDSPVPAPAGQGNTAAPQRGTAPTNAAGTAEPSASHRDTTSAGAPGSVGQVAPPRDGTDQAASSHNPQQPRPAQHTQTAQPGQQAQSQQSAASGPGWPADTGASGPAASGNVASASQPSDSRPTVSAPQPADSRSPEPGPTAPQPTAPQPAASRNAASQNAGTRPAASRPSAPLPDDWPQEPSDPGDVPESNAWETAAAPEEIHISSAVSDDEWANTNWAGTTAARPAGQSGGRPSGQAPAGRPVTGSGFGSAAPSGSGGPSGPGAPSGPAAGIPSGAAAQGSNASATQAASRPGSTGLASPGSTRTAAQGNQAQPAEAQAPAGNHGNRPLSRYQKLLNEAAQRNGTAAPAAGRGTVDLGYVEDVPSADDVTLEDSGLVGRKAIERILGGRLIEERSLDGHDMRR